MVLERGGGTNSHGFLGSFRHACRPYDVRLSFPQSQRTDATAHFQAGASLTEQLGPGAAECIFKSVRLEGGPARVEGWLSQNGRTTGVHYLEVKRLR